MKHVKRILCVLLVFAVFIGSFIGSSFLFSTGTYEIDERYLAIFDNENETPTYYLRRAAQDQVFRITTLSDKDGTGFELCDSKGDDVKAKVIRISNNVFDIAAPKGGYKKGETYKLSIEKGLKFEDKKITDTKELVFTVVRDEIEEYELQKDVIELEDTFRITEENTVKLSDKSLKAGDIVYGKDKYGMPDSFKITENLGGGSYAVEAPAIDEVYSKLNIYGSFDWSVAGVESEEGLDIKLLENVRSSDFYSSLALVSHAADINDSVTVSTEKKTNLVTVEADFKLVPDKDPLFGIESLYGHSVTITLKEQFRMSSDIDYKDTDEWDIATHTSLTTSWSVDVSMNNEDAKKGDTKDLFTSKSCEPAKDHEKQLAGIVSALNTITRDEASSRIKLFDWNSPIDKYSIFDLNAEIFLYVDFSLAGETKVEQSTTTEMSYGIRRNNGELSPYSARRVSNEPTEFSLRGDTRVECGLDFDIRIDILNEGITSIGLIPRAGSYARAFTTIPILDKESVSEKALKYFYFEPGLFFRIDFEVFINLSKDEDVSSKLQILNSEFPFDDLTMGTQSIPLGFAQSDYVLVPEADNKTVLLPEMLLQCYDVKKGEIVSESIDWSSIELRDSDSNVKIKTNNEKITLPEGASGIMSCIASYTHENESKYSANITIELSKGSVVGQVSTYAKSIDDTEPIENAVIEVCKENTDTVIKTASTDSRGAFSLDLAEGVYELAVSCDGYMTLITTQTVKTNEVTHTEHIMLIDELSGTGGCSGTVTNAIDGESLPNVSLRLRSGWNNTKGDYAEGYSATTDSEGKFTVSGINVGYYTVEASRNGFVTGYCNIIAVKNDQRTDYNISVTPELSDEEVRIVLNWGSDPQDLDAVLDGTTPNGDDFYINWQNKRYSYNGYDYARLDVDKREGNGPETITISKSIEGETLFYVLDFENQARKTSTALSYSNAVVRVYQGSALKAEFHVPANNEGTIWNVFTIDEDFNITPINKISNKVEG